MRHILRDTYRALVPDRIRQLRGNWIRRRGIRATEELRQATGCVIQSGPLQGMHYLAEAHQSELGPKLLGTYELEVTGQFLEMVGGRFRRFIDIGAAEGYYACGARFLNPTLEVIAFEGEEGSRARIRDLLVLNGLDGQVRIEGFCSHGALRAFLDPAVPTALLVDIDGGELSLLDPTELPELINATILVELHDFVDPRITATLRSRFEPSHIVSHIPVAPRRASVLPRIPGMRSRDLGIAAQEARPDGQAWLWLTPHRAE